MTGRRGEDAAERWMRRRGWVVLARNWRGGGGELDLVALRDGIVAVCEVKTRGDEAALADPVRRAQRERVVRATAAFLARRPHLAGALVRFDVLTVRAGAAGLRVRHLAGAFDGPPGAGQGSNRRSSA
ncbi:MAG: YraN family protein [Thermoleophilia bacterium]|nr:YraN family protein [Thermoleophilia bacterium]